jgi:hypothetical protein
MKKLSRESWLIIGLFSLLVLLTIVTAVYQVRQSRKYPPLSSSSSAPDGARALRLWLGEIGYRVSAESGETFAPPDKASLTLVLEPLTRFTAEEWQTIDAWVQEGGTLLLAGDGRAIDSAANHYNLDLIHLSTRVLTLTAQTPLFAQPPLQGPVHVQTRTAFKTERDDVVVHLAAGSNPVLLSLEIEAGRVILCATAFPFSNRGLKETGNPELVLNLVAVAERSGVIWFDEWHHGLRPKETRLTGPGDWLRQSPVGRSLLYVAGVIFVALVLRGRRFGRPVPLSKDGARRAPLEYITAVANLGRRARHRAAVLSHYRQQLKRDLGKRYRLDPTLPDGEYVAQLAELNPNLDPNALLELLTRLSRAKVSENEMIQMAVEAAEWLRE